MINNEHILPPPRTPPPRPPKRSEQVVGVQFATPKKRRPPRKDAVIVSRPDAALRQQVLEEELRQLKQPDRESVGPSAAPDGGQFNEDVEMTDLDPPSEEHQSVADLTDVLPETKIAPPRRTLPDEESQRLYGSWLALIPTLVPAYLAYMQAAQGRMGQTAGPHQQKFICRSGKCSVKASTILCLYFDYLVSVPMQYCACASITQVLIHNGLFPASPSAPRVAISLDLLDFYFALFERSADAITALAGALKTMYVRRGFPVLNEKGEPVQDPFRRGIGHAVQWYDQLRSRPDVMVEHALDACLKKISSENLAEVDVLPPTCEGGEVNVSGLVFNPGSSNTTSNSGADDNRDGRDHMSVDSEATSRQCTGTSSQVEASFSEPKLGGCVPDSSSKIRPTADGTEETPQTPLTPGSCNRLLQKRCAACFGGTTFGRTYKRDGGDIHVALDATFSQRHNASAGESPWFYEPKYFVSKEEVDAAGARITAARKKPARTYTGQVPAAAIDECEKSYEAADEKKEKTHGKKFDDTGLMALVCRHDIVLFLANIDTPGEQQKYAIALLDKLFEYIPEAATVAAFYDIGCVLDRSVQVYDLLSESVASRLIFATSAMHAYGHQWACQLVYNPRLREGLGLSDGEGTERVWSKFRKLIGVTRSSARSRRIWILDRHADALNRTTREDLGIWIRSRLKNGVEARTLTAQKELAKINISKDELRKQWEAQKAAQLSVRKHAPARLKKELDSVLNLQAELTTVETSLARLQTSVESGNENPIVHDYIASLKRSHARAIEKVEGLYASLNVPQEFPELRGLPLNFVQILLMARDLKINIRKRAIGSFFEWDKLNRAAGGRDQPLGTKLHQQTQKAITRRTPALTTAIKKFNGYCAQLSALHQQEWNLPLPEPLPTELAVLRDDPSLLADVWITPSSVSVPRWLQDSSVRQGIRAMLILDRCLEERRRLCNEAENLCRWYGRELAAVELALRLPDFSAISFLLLQRKEELLLLQMRWKTPLVPVQRFQSYTEDAARIARYFTGTSETNHIQWVHVPDQDGVTELGLSASEGDYVDEEVVIAHDTLDELLSFEESDNEDALVDPLPVCSHPLQHDLEDAEMIVHRTLFFADEHPYGPTFATDIPLPENPLAPTWTSPTKTLALPITDTRPLRFVFPPKDLRRLHNPQALLSDDCINSGSELLHRHHVQRPLDDARCPAILSTRIVSLHRAGADDGILWRDANWTRYWKKDIWIIPIHHLAPAAHWTLAIVYLRKQPHQIAYFDSLASKSTWDADSGVLYNLIYRLHRIAVEEGNVAPAIDTEQWLTYPLVTRPLQNNAVDCGVWVLACVSAILQGYDGVQLTEGQLSVFRSRLTLLVLEKATEV